MNNHNETKHICRLAAPVLLNYLLSSLFEILDEAIVGHYSSTGFALVGIAGSVVYSITGAVGILSAAFHITAAEKKGRQDNASFEALFLSCKVFAVAAGLLFLLLAVLGGGIFFETFYHLNGHELALLLSYFYPASITVLLNMLLFLYSAYFRNLFRTRIAVAVTVVSTGINLFFDYALVYGAFGLPELGIAGAAWGSVIGLIGGLIVYQAAYYRRLSHAASRSALRNRRALFRNLKKVLSLYPALFGQEFLESTVFVLLVTAAVSGLGTTQTAVYKLLDIVCSTLALPVYAFATAAQTYALQARSADNSDSIKRYLRAGLALSFFVLAVICALCFPLREYILSWIVSDRAVICGGESYFGLIFLIVSAKIPYQICMVYLQGIGKERYVFVCTALGALLTGIAITAAATQELSAVYLCMAAEFLTLGGIYLRKVKMSLR